jgi:hypothetical protein
MCNIKTDKTLIPGRNGDISILFRAARAHKELLRPEEIRLA